jgi:hypothetical protein
VTKRTVDQDGNVYEIRNETSGGLDLMYVGKVGQPEMCDPDTCLGPPPEYDYICQHPWSHPMVNFNHALFGFLDDQKS